MFYSQSRFYVLSVRYEPRLCILSVSFKYCGSVPELLQLISSWPGESSWYTFKEVFKKRRKESLE